MSTARWTSTLRTLLTAAPLLTTAPLLVAAAGAVALDEAKPLRLCADPDNLPFSSNKSDTPGLYVEIGQALGQAMGRPVTVVWQLSYFGKRMLRTTLLAAECDASVGIPGDPSFMGPRVIFSKPLFEIGYALVTPKSLSLTALQGLTGRRVAVQFATTPQNLLAQHDDIQAVTFLEPEAAMQALAAQKLDAAFIWGPSAGYVNKTMLRDAFKVTPVSGPGLQWSAAVGFARGNSELRDAVNAAIDKIGPAIDALKAKYGVPAAAPVPLSRAASVKPANALPADAFGLPRFEPAAASGVPSKLVLVVEDTKAGGPVTNDVGIAEGREVFNGICGHCHGPDAVQAERRIDLRLLRHRYGDKMDETFRYTVTHGRPAKGMPNWSEVLTADQIEKVLNYLHSVQGD